VFGVPLHAIVLSFLESRHDVGMQESKTLDELDGLPW
jgi:hypothetical protein